MTRVVAGLLALLFLVGVAVAERVTVDSDHFIEETLVADYHRPICLDNGGDTLYGWDRDTLKLEWYDGSSWGTVYDFSARTDAAAHARRIYVDSAGSIYLSFIGGGKLFQVTRAPFALGDSLTLQDTSADVLYMAEDDSCLYFGEYDGTGGDTTARIWRSVDAGATWHPKYHDATADHIHGVWADPYRDGTVYASMGDGTAKAEIVKSTDFGLNWSSILASDCRAQFTDMLFLNDTRIMGMDCRVADRDSGGVFVTTDDSAFTDTLDLVGVHAAHIYAMSMNADSTGFAATFRRNGETSNIAMYRMSGQDNNKGQWRRVALYEASAASGIWDLTDFDTNGNAYYTDLVRQGLYKFNDAPILTVGVGGDYDSIYTAMQASDPGDTIVLLAGSHRLSHQPMEVHGRLTIRSSTRNPADVIVWPTNAAIDGFDLGAGDTLTTIGFTVRNSTDLIGTSPFVWADSTGSWFAKKVEFKDYDGADSPVYATTAAGYIRWQNCVVESTKATTANKWLIRAQSNSDQHFVDCIFANNLSTDALLLLYHGGAQDSIRVQGCLFVDNSISGDTGILRIHPNVASTGAALIDNCTFDNSECAADAVDGVINNSGVAEITTLQHTIISNADSTYAVNEDKWDLISYVDVFNVHASWGGFNDALGGTGSPTANDTLTLDPDYNKTGTALTGWYQAKDNTVRDHANGRTDYMGWELWTIGGSGKVGAPSGRSDDKIGHHR